MMSSPLLLCLLSVALAGPALASERGDHERARAAVEAGRALPLHEIIGRVRTAYGGEILDVELDDEHGRLIYEIKILAPGGRLLEVEYDAATGAPLKTEGHRPD